MGRLVQPPPPLRVLRRHPTRGTGDCLLRSTPETSRRLSSQIRKSPDSPGRFNLIIARMSGGSSGASEAVTSDHHPPGVPARGDSPGRVDAAFLLVSGLLPCAACHSKRSRSTVLPFPHGEASVNCARTAPSNRRVPPSRRSHARIEADGFRDRSTWALPYGLQFRSVSFRLSPVRYLRLRSRVLTASRVKSGGRTNRIQASNPSH
jgi:hypothetical protein